MSSPVSSLASGYAALQATGLLNDLPFQFPSSAESGSPQDLTDLGTAALQLQQADQLLGVTPPNANTEASGSNILNTLLPPSIPQQALPDVTPQQQATLDNVSVTQQQVEALFGAPSAPTNTLGVFA